MSFAQKCDYFRGIFSFSFFKVVDIIIDRIISDRETYRKIVFIYPKIAGSNRAQSFFKKFGFSFINIISILHITESYIFVWIKEGGKIWISNLDLLFFCFLYLLSSFCFSLSELNWHQKFALAKKYDWFFVLEVCWISYCTKMAQKNAVE